MDGVDEEYLKEIEMARRELVALITSNKDAAPLMFRLAWHDAGNYDATTGTGGPNGSIRTFQELNHKANEGLGKAVQLCGDLKAKAKLERVSFADLYQLAGVVAVEVTGGPSIDFVPGRKDLAKSPPEGRLLDGKEDISHLRETFSRMGLSDDKDIVALCGGLRTMYLGKPREDRSEGQWTKDPLKFDNSYFKELLRKDAPFSRLPMDNALVADEKFYHYVKQYSKDEDSFFKDYAVSHKKLSELGCNPDKINQPKVSNEKLNQPKPKVQDEKLNQPKPKEPDEKLNQPEVPPDGKLNRPKGPCEKIKQNKGLIGISIVSVVVTVILGFLLKRKKNQVKN
ncbi:L-ascorbate peroxidase 3 [Spatholobus suberectus]|nr:L-ascorbate peroxidase 3 [Spatholobus suberectus]